MRIFLGCLVALLMTASAGHAAEMRFRPFDDYAPVPPMRGTVKTVIQPWTPVTWREPAPMRVIESAGPFRVVEVPMQGRYRPYAPIKWQ